jgi:hypothetical protein
MAGITLIITACNMPLAKPTALPAPTGTPPLPFVTPEATVTIPYITAPTESLPIPTETAEPAPAHVDIPGSPIGKVFQTVWDQVDEKTAPQKQAFGGDDFRNGKYERPFDQAMNYLPLVDLVSVQLNREDPLWTYVLFKVDKPFTDDPDAEVSFAIELDTDLNNRGNYLIVSARPRSTEWSTDSVLVLNNPDMNIGGELPVVPDISLSEGRGYYNELFNSGTGEDPDLAWSRLSAIDSSVAEIAFKNTLAGGETGKFIWLPWADTGMLDWSKFEVNDHFYFTEAGYPLKEDAQNYPLKALWGIDNTCRVPSGFTPVGTMPGQCPDVVIPDVPAAPHTPHICHRPCISHPGCCD